MIIYNGKFQVGEIINVKEDYSRHLCSKNEKRAFVAAMRAEEGNFRQRTLNCSAKFFGLRYRSNYKDKEVIYTRHHLQYYRFSISLSCFEVLFYSIGTLTISTCFIWRGGSWHFKWQLNATKLKEIEGKIQFSMRARNYPNINGSFGDLLSYSVLF